MTNYVTALKCYCTTNKNFCGSWNAEDVRAELNDDDKHPMPDGEWIVYALCRHLGYVEGWSRTIEDAISEDNIKELTAILDGHEVTIKKFYHLAF